MKTISACILYTIICLLFISSFYSVYAAPDSAQTPVINLAATSYEQCNGKVVIPVEIECSNVLYNGGVCTVTRMYEHKQIKILSTMFPLEHELFLQWEYLLLNKHIETMLLFDFCFVRDCKPIYLLIL